MLPNFFNFDADIDLDKIWNKVFESFGGGQTKTIWEEERDCYSFIYSSQFLNNGKNVKIAYIEKERMVEITIESDDEQGYFYKNFVESLPADADPKTLSAVVSSNVLTVIVDKKKPQSEAIAEEKAKEIPIEVL